MENLIMMTITYEGKNALYLNITNRCPCACVFCLRKNKTAREKILSSNKTALTLEKRCAKINMLYLQQVQKSFEDNYGNTF